MDPSSRVAAQVAASVGPANGLRSPLAADCEEVRQLLHREAQRCFRLARGIASLELAEELEEIGRAFEREAATLEGAH